MVYQRAREDFSKHCLIQGPVCKYVSFLVKSLLSNTLPHEDVHEALEKVANIYPALMAALMKFEFTPGKDSGFDYLHEQVIMRLAYVFKCIRGLDKRNWHHKPIYMYARIMGDVLGNLEEAKELLIGLVVIRSPSRCFKSIWKTDFERPGCHYIYLLKYAAYLLELANRTEDIPLLGLLCQRLHKVDESHTLMKKTVLLNEAKKFLLVLLNRTISIAEDIFEEFCGRFEMSQTELLLGAETCMSKHCEFQQFCIACDLKRARIVDGYDSFIVGMYCKLFLANYSGTSAGMGAMTEEAKKKIVAKILVRALAVTRTSNPTVLTESL